MRVVRNYFLVGLIGSIFTAVIIVNQDRIFSSKKEIQSKSASQESYEQTQDNYRSSRGNGLGIPGGLTYQKYYMSNGYFANGGDTTEISYISTLYFLEDNSLLWILDEDAAPEGSPWRYWPTMVGIGDMSIEPAFYQLAGNQDITDIMSSGMLVFSNDFVSFNFGPTIKTDKPDEAYYKQSWNYFDVIKGEKGVF